MLDGDPGSLPEGRSPGHEGVVPFDRHEAYQHQQTKRRHQNGIHQGQPLPAHVHEDGDYQPRLHQHEHQDQRPPEVTLKVEVVDEIRERAENKQQSPDPQDKRQSDVVVLLREPCYLLPKIKERKDEYPHQIDEVPIQTHDFDDLVVPLPAGHKTWPLTI